MAAWSLLEIGAAFASAWAGGWAFGLTLLTFKQFMEKI